MTEETSDKLSTVWEILAKWGPWTLLVFYLLGAIPGVPSPNDKASAEHKIQNEGQKDLLKTMRGMCYRLKGTSDPRTNCE